MSWIVLSLLSAFLLGIYDILKKVSVRENAVPVVLLVSCLTAALLWIPAVLLSRSWPGFEQYPLFYVDALSGRDHLHLFGKSLLVGASWSCAFFALKRLPITIAAPIRATSPLWTIMIACSLLGERPGSLQWLGMLAILGSFFAFTLVGKREGIHFHRDRGVGLMCVATLLAAASALYDKYLLQSLGYRVATVQAWFSIYLVPVMLPLALVWVVRKRTSQPFIWRWSIPAIAVSLLAADYLYFSAVHQPDAMISLISPLRRVSVVVAFVAGSQMFREQNLRPKLACVAVMLVGVWLIRLGA